MSAAMLPDPADGALQPAWPIIPVMPQLAPGWTLDHMTARDLQEVARIEQRAYSHPWTRGNFENSLKAGHGGLTLRDPSNTLVGYAMLMPVVDEMHLLNITVDPDRQRQGLGRLLLAIALATTHRGNLHTMLLEVRPSNLGALALYLEAGFVEIGRRKGYYPATALGREDALVLRRMWPSETGGVPA
ncbi:ribosomal protein S18-alanine N-acetyltransferase [Cupriavidus agavae]|uniref:[Ribosomal protein bS18]-alanine N-acetyltransferase n=1 Tax=Cupriavidus agavae TaxID=1001822 RepID=A0A4Q7S878_9BURK|nr:ribosomal protein S18-alanine N-acetyltransferase [Cupriavidus agavae]RZT41958.1 [SSU ribosomal protein S18P]-alanine acetyltransferase [Cupriavidus agavae]